MALDKIDNLEKSARLLELGSDDMKSILSWVVRFTDSFITGLDEAPLFSKDNSALDLLEAHPFTENGIDPDSALELFDGGVNQSGLNPASPGHLGYIPGGGLFTSAVGDYLAAISNKFAGLYFSSPGSVRVENQCIRWTADLIGYPSSAQGNITSGGSIANLIALVTARDHKSITPDKIQNSVIYYTQQTHHCVQKAVKIAGLGHCVERRIKVDNRYRMDTSDLHRQIKQDVSQGLTPFFVAASCGSTDTGAVDPFEEIADICEDYGVWMHVDGAYGGYFALVDELKSLFRGIERSDSMVLDPHKTLFLPYGSGIVIVKNGSAMVDSFECTANYLQDAVSSENDVSPADVSPELTKHFRGLRMWLPLQIHGVQPFRDALYEKHLLTLYFHEEVEKLGFEVGPTPQLSVGIYRYIPSEGDANTYNASLMQRIKKDGRIFVSSTTIDGTFWLRIALVSFRTHKKHVDRFLGILEEFTV